MVIYIVIRIFMSFSGVDRPFICRNSSRVGPTQKHGNHVGAGGGIVVLAQVLRCLRQFIHCEKCFKGVKGALKFSKSLP